MLLSMPCWPDSACCSQVPNGATTGLSVSFAWGDEGSLDVQVQNGASSAHQEQEQAPQQQAQPAESSSPEPSPPPAQVLGSWHH